MKNIADRIRDFNSGRDPERLALKYAAMRKGPFVFLRGTCHLFYEDLKISDLPKSPLAWCCGDLHLENLGTYKGDNRLVYFDLNDFDEACLAPANWDIVRFLTSILIGGKMIGMDRSITKLMMREFLQGYRSALQTGKARWLERATSEGIIRALITQLRNRTVKGFLNSRTTTAKGKRKLITDGRHALPLQKRQLPMLRNFIKKFGSMQPDPAFYTFIDGARRIAGTGSLGLERYVLLVEGNGSPNENFLLDLKYQPGSCVVAAKHLPQPKWNSESQRVVVTQHDVQAVSPALLSAVEMEGRSFVIHELMPENDRLDFTKWRDDVKGFQDAMRIMGEITAWGNLRASGRRGAASADDLIAYGQEEKWTKHLMAYAGDCADRTKQQWREYVASELGVNAAIDQ